MIDMVVKYTWTERDGKTAWEYRVYHEAVDSFSRGRRYTYSHDKKLPVTVVDFMMDAKLYGVERPRFTQRQNLKIEYFKMKDKRA